MFSRYRIYVWDNLNKKWSQVAIARCNCSPDCQDVKMQTTFRNIAEVRLRQLIDEGYNAQIIELDIAESWLM